MLSSKALTPTTPVCRWKSSPRSALPRNHQLRLLPSSTLSFPHHSSAPPSTSSSDATTASTSFCVTNLSSSIGTPSSTFTQWSLDQRHMLALNAVACVAFKRAAESMEKLLDATREELPNTMAAVRLTGMEISDLTMELSDLGLAFNICIISKTNKKRNLVTYHRATPAVAKTARGLRHGIINGRAIFRSLALNRREEPSTFPNKCWSSKRRKKALQ
ncbi:hypothetical protein EJ110_NYTH07795 [Nymphaea thermarum]|nr:hypothetical protein EJ110_NYTH07795 [Nymphaea thermarum]